MLLGELRRWGADPADVATLLPACRPGAGLDRAVRRPGRRRLRRVPAGDRPGLRNQGWKDSFDGVNVRRRADRRHPHRARRGAGIRVRRLRRPGRARRARRRRRHGASAGPPGRRAPRRVQPSDSGCPSAAGSPSASTGTSGRSTAWPRTWATACGPASSTRTRPRRWPSACSSPEMFTGWGVRTLASSMGGLQPDELPQRLGLAARQRPDRGRADALRVRRARAADRQRPARRGRRASAAGCRSCSAASTATEFEAPVPYPTSCSPQAWAAATPTAAAAHAAPVRPGRARRPGRGSRPPLPAGLGRPPASNGVHGRPAPRMTVAVADGDGRDDRAARRRRGRSTPPAPPFRRNASRRPTGPHDPSPCPSRPMRIAMIAPPWFTVPPVGYGGVENVVRRPRGRPGRSAATRSRSIGAGEPGTQADQFVATYAEPPSGRLGRAAARGAAHRGRGPRPGRARRRRRARPHAGRPLLARGRRAPTVVTMHGPVRASRGSTTALLRRTCRPGRHLARPARRRPPTWRGSGTVHNAVDVGSFPFRRREGRRCCCSSAGCTRTRAPTWRSTPRERPGCRSWSPASAPSRWNRSTSGPTIEPRLGPDVTIFGDGGRHRQAGPAVPRRGPGVPDPAGTSRSAW